MKTQRFGDGKVEIFVTSMWPKLQSPESFTNAKPEAVLAQASGICLRQLREKLKRNTELNLHVSVQPVA